MWRTLAVRERSAGFFFMNQKPATVLIPVEALQEAAQLLSDGGLVAFPTETVYGLGADARNEEAVARIFEAKGRPKSHPLIMHLAHVSWFSQVVDPVTPELQALVDRFWPGPLTLIVPRNSEVPYWVTGGLETVGLRIPDHPVAQKLLEMFDGPVAAPSANRFGRVSPTCAEHVLEELEGRVDAVVDGGSSPVGLESTILDCTGEKFRILRPGFVTYQALEEILGDRLAIGVGGGNVRAPGTLPVHYAPRARVVLAQGHEAADRVNSYCSQGKRVFLFAAQPLSPELDARAVFQPAPTDVEEYARELYGSLRGMDAQQAEVVVVVPPLEEGLGVAIHDRLRRAAAAH